MLLFFGQTKIDEVAHRLIVSITAVCQNKSIPRHKQNSHLFFRSEILTHIKRWKPINAAIWRLPQKGASQKVRYPLPRLPEVLPQ